MLVDHSKKEEEGVAEVFLNGNIPTRLNKSIALAKAKDARRIRSFVASLSRAAAALPQGEEKRQACSAILHAEKLISRRGAQGKTILDYLAVSIPVFKK